MKISETRRSRGKPSVPGVLEEVVLSVSTPHFNGQRSDMHVRKLQNAESDKIVNGYPIVFVRGKGISGSIGTLRRARVQRATVGGEHISSVYTELTSP